MALGYNKDDHNEDDHGTELLKAEDVRTHVRAHFLRTCAKFVLLKAKQEKQALFLMILAQFDKIL